MTLELQAFFNSNQIKSSYYLAGELIHIFLPKLHSELFQWRAYIAIWTLQRS